MTMYLSFVEMKRKKGRKRDRESVREREWESEWERETRDGQYGFDSKPFVKC